MSRLLLCCLLVLLPGLASAAADDGLQAALDRHLRQDAAWWLEEPRLTDLLRTANRTALDDSAIARLERQWEEELAGDGGELSDRIASRFVSNYLAEVVLRLDGAYRTLVLLDLRGLVVAASELPDRLRPATATLSTLAQRADAAWVQDRRPLPGQWTQVALPVRDADGARLGTLLLEVDAGRLPGTALREAALDTRRR